jgi:hypothetical protein
VEFEKTDRISKSTANPECPSAHLQREKSPDSDLLGELTGGIRNYLSGFFDGFSFQDLDSGDILLLLIILFLYLEGDNLDIVIALGVMIFLSFGNSAQNDITPHGERSHQAE